MRFYRVCHTWDGSGPAYAGPYIGHGGHEDADGNECPIQDMGIIHSERTHPSPSQELWISPRRKWYWNKDWSCGFTTPAKLNTWFRGWYGPLISCGFVVREYDIHHMRVMQGEYQDIALIKDEATNIHTLHPIRGMV